mmetsp:Transcript_28724/g.66911  ORF Transcript_28724/g.66911 Transcript_28724/m.66911 type:complete len:395 (+) Transcript_28724:50-1234(+)
MSPVERLESKLPGSPSEHSQMRPQGGLLHRKEMPERLVLESNAPLPFSWTLPLNLHTPERISLAPARYTRSSDVIELRDREPDRRLELGSVSPVHKSTPEHYFHAQERCLPQVRRYSLCTPESGSPQWKSIQKDSQQSSRGPETGTGMSQQWAGFDEPSTNLRLLFADLREELQREQRAGQRALLEQGVRTQGQLRCEFENWREETCGALDSDGCTQPRRCPRCCREAVESAVEAVMEGVLCAVRDALHVEVPHLKSNGWQALADEVWESISFVGSSRRRSARESNCGRSHPTPDLKELAPLRDFLCGSMVAATGTSVGSCCWHAAAAPSALPLEHGQDADAHTWPVRQDTRKRRSAGKENRDSWSLQEVSSNLGPGRKASPPQSPARMQCFLR